MAFPGVDIPAIGAISSVFRVPIDYILEVRLDGQLKGTIAVPNHPSMLAISQPHANSIRHTLGRDPIIESTSNRTRMIAIRGNTGYAARAGYNAQGQVIFAPAAQIAKEFRDFINNYQELAEEYPQRTSMIFRAFNEDENYRCEIVSYNLARTAANPLTADWGLVLEAYDTAQSDPPFNILSPYSDLFELAANYVDLANGYVALASNTLSNLRGDMESLRAPLQALGRTAAALNNVIAGAREVARFPAALLSDFANVAVSFKAAWEGVVGNRFDDPIGLNGWTALKGEWEVLKRRLGYMAEDVARDAVTALGVSGGGPEDIASATARAAAIGDLYARAPFSPDAADAASGLQAVTVTLRAGESLRDIAQRFYGDPNRWIEIAEYNHWQSMHRLGSGRPARVREVIFVPIGAISQEAPSTDTDPFKKDIRLTDDGDLLLDGGGSFKTVRGAENLNQALAGRLLTVQGESKGFPAYGLPRIIGSGGSSALKSYIAAVTREQILRDFRLRAIKEIQVEDGGDVFYIDATVYPQIGDTIDLSAPIPTGE